jgi:hypothetical protein
MLNEVKHPAAGYVRERSEGGQRSDAKRANVKTGASSPWPLGAKDPTLHLKKKPAERG